MSKIMRQFEFHLRTNVKMGPGISASLGEELKAQGWEKIGIVVDANIVRMPAVKKILESVKKVCASSIIWEYDIKGEPDYDSLNRVRKLFLNRQNKPLIDCFVGIGGGSSIDFAKGLAILTVNLADALNYRGFPKDIKTPLPVIAVPTVAGSGSEVTFNASFIDWNSKKKMGINSFANFPRLAILDPMLALSCPFSVSVASAMDSLVHTLESYAANQANALTRAFAKEAFGFIINALPRLKKHPDDIEMRGNLQLGAYLAGVSLCNAGSGPAGALSYPLGVHFKVPHGLAGAVFLPYLIEFNVKRGYDYTELYDLTDKADKSLPKKKKNRMFSENLFFLNKQLGIPLGLRGFGVNEETIGILLQETESLQNAFNQNPLPFSVEDGKKLLQRMITIK